MVRRWIWVWSGGPKNQHLFSQKGGSIMFSLWSPSYYIWFLKKIKNYFIYTETCNDSHWAFWLADEWIPHELLMLVCCKNFHGNLYSKLCQKWYELSTNFFLSMKLWCLQLHLALILYQYLDYARNGSLLKKVLKQPVSELACFWAGLFWNWPVSELACFELAFFGTGLFWTGLFSNWPVLNWPVSKLACFGTGLFWPAWKTGR